ncbi:MAG: DUF350 domain-containing protein [Flavobacteriaceae bacterium]|nr:DUF350 domain-containing protein [Flavobacteriaceae bacterium]
MENIIENEYFVLFSESITYILTAFFMFYIGKLAYGLFNRKINVKNELVEKDNFAFAIAHTGYFIGLLLAIGAAIVGPSKGLMTDVTEIAFYGFLAIILLNLSMFINDKIILRKFSVYKEIIEDRNEGTGVVEAASAIGSGLIIYGAVTGESDGGLLGGFISAVLFWFVGQIVLIISAKIYNMWISYDVFEEIEKDNRAVGIAFAGVMIAMANIVRFAISGDFNSYLESLQNISFDIVIGLIMLPILRFLTDKILLPGQKITDELVNQEKPNMGVGLIEAFAYIGGSVLITWCL